MAFGLPYPAWHDDSPSLPGNFINQLMIDRRKNLWLQVSGLKVGIFDRKNFTFREALLKPTQESGLYAEKQLVQDDDGNIFVILWNNELLTYNEQKNEFAPSHNFIQLPEGWKITGLTHLPGTKKYIIGTGKGIAIYNKQTGELSYTGHNEGKEELIEKIGKTTGAAGLLVDNKDRLWFDSWETGASMVYCYDTKNNSTVLYRYSFQPLVNTYHELKGLLEQRNGDIWISGMGIFGRYNEKEKQFQLVHNGYESEQSITYNKINALFEDREGSIWVATDLNGLYRFNPQEQFFTSIRQVNRYTGKLGNGSAMSFMWTRQGDLLVGTWEDGLYRYDRNYNIRPLNLPAIEGPVPSIWSMCQSHYGKTIWMGAQPGLWRFDEVKQTTDFYSPALIKNRTIRQIAEDPYGNLWMGTQSMGVFKWTASASKKFDDGVSFINDVPAGMITRITIDNGGLVWVATPSYGLYVLDPATDKLVMHFGTKEPEERKLFADGVIDAMPYDDTTVIIASNSLALFNTRQKKITRTIQLPELVSGTITALVRDKQGYLWMSTTSGIYRVNIHNKIFLQFDRRDGMANDRFIPAASYVLPDGKILFGADNGFVSFDPEQVRMNNASPDIKITGFKLANQSLHLDSLLQRKQIELSPKENSITIEFAGLSYNNAYIIRYKLEGLEKEWKLADRNYQAIYSYLPPGTYTFLAKSEDAEGNPSKNITRLSFVVNPPFWKTWWFFCVLALIVAGIFYWLDKQRVNKILALQDVRTEIASNCKAETS
jgi:ligand-binding sensor domain-containing protein